VLAKNLPRRSRDKRVPPTDGFRTCKGHMSFMNECNEFWEQVRTGEPSEDLGAFFVCRHPLRTPTPLLRGCLRLETSQDFAGLKIAHRPPQCRCRPFIWKGRHNDGPCARVLTSLPVSSPKTWELLLASGYRALPPYPFRHEPFVRKTSQDFGSE
jgi:hypothetical protein